MQDDGSVAPRRGRGAGSNPVGRFEPLTRSSIDDGWWREAELPPLPTTVTDETCRTVISRNSSPDVPFDRSINPYRGCEHGCVYCFARPTHAYLGLSPGLDFETRLFAKPDAARILERELRKPGYQPRPIMLGANTDPYQPIERRRQITREILEVLARFRHPVAIATKSALVARDIDLLAPMAEQRLASVGISVTTLDSALARIMEPRASSPAKRLAAMRALSEAGVPVAVMAAPMIPFINDHELERILEAASAHGAGGASYVLLRLPLELKELFTEWLGTHFPDRASRVLGRLRDCRDGQLYVADWGTRMKGQGAYADLLARRFALAARRFGLDRAGPANRSLDCSRFRPPPVDRPQPDLFA
jgi:DNA repair photolyase